MRLPARVGRPDGAPVVVAAVVAVQLWALRHLLLLVSWPNDLSFHASMVDWATGRFDAGQVPTDGWYPRLSGGLPQFHLYQSLPHILTGLLGTAIGPERAVHLMLWLLVATWPVPLYVGARALGLSAPAAAAAAVASPLVRSATGYGFEPFSYLWLGNGLWSQAWGMWVAPLALGWSARAVRSGSRYGRAVSAAALTVAFHLPTAWFVLVALGLWLLVRPGEWRARLPRVAGVGALTVLASAWVLVPFLVDRWAGNSSSFNGQGGFADSFGWRRVGGWVLAGDVLDAHRLPVLSVVAAAGLVVAVASWRRAEGGHREVVAVAALSLVLFVGRDPFRLPIALLPGSSQVFLHRYVATLQLGLVLAVGLAAGAVWRWLEGRRATRRRSGATGVGAAVAVGVVLVVGLALAGPVRATSRLLGEDARWVHLQQRQDRGDGRDAAELVAIAHERGGGRIFAGRLNGTGQDLRIGSVPAPVWLAHLPVDGVGFTLRVSSLAADLETYLDESSVADLDAFGIRYVLVGTGQVPPAGTWFLAARGRFQLWEVPGDGLVSAAHVTGPARPVGNHELAAALLPILRAQGGSPTSVRLLDLEGRSPAVPVQRTGLGSRPGTLSGTHADLEAGRLDTTTDFTAPGAVVVKANWNPRWEATVDGHRVPVAAVAPTWLAVPVGPGRHHVELRYRPWPWTAPLLVLAVLAIATGAWWSHRTRRAPAAAQRGADPEAEPAGPSGGGERPVRLRRRVAIGAAAVACLATTGCGTPHRLPSTTARHPPTSSPLAAVSLLRSGSFATLDRVLAPEGRTVLVAAPGSCTACTPLLAGLARAAFGRRPFSVVVLERAGSGEATVAGPLAEACARLGLSHWTVVGPTTPGPRAEAQTTTSAAVALGLDEGDGVAVVRADGTVAARWPTAIDREQVADIIEEAKR